MTELVKAIEIPSYLRDQIEQFDDLPNELKELWQPIYTPGAERFADAMQAELATRAPDDVIAAWLLDLETCVATNLSAQQIGARIAAVIGVLGNLPPCCWTKETLHQAAKKFHFFPTVAELAELLEPVRENQLRTIKILRHAAKPQTQPGTESAQPYAKLSAPPRPARHFNPRPEPDELRAITQEPIRNVEQQMREIGITDPQLLNKAREIGNLSQTNEPTRSITSTPLRTALAKIPDA